MGLEDVSLHAACHQLNFTYFAMRMEDGRLRVFYQQLNFIDSAVSLEDLSVRAIQEGDACVCF